MSGKRRLTLVGVLLLSSAGCSSSSANVEPGDASQTGVEDEDDGLSMSSTASTTAGDPSSGGDDGGEDCGSFLGCTWDLPGYPTCDFWAQDCPEGEKCTPVAPGPGVGSFDDAACVPVLADPAGVGEPCNLLDEGPPGTDSCDAVSKCFDIDPETAVGACIGLCQGPQSDPQCPAASGPGAVCWQSGFAGLKVCVAPCDPLLDGACPAGQVCVELYEAWSFGCFVPRSEGTGGEACACTNCCAAGHRCVAADDYGPDCPFDACCTEYCDVDDTSFSCQGADQVCVPLFDPNTPEVGHIGHCVVV